MSLAVSFLVFVVFVIGCVSSQCTLNVDISLGNPWTNNGIGYRVANLILSNSGSTPITSAQLQLSFQDPSYSTYQSWGLDAVSSNIFSLSGSPDIIQGSPLTVGFIFQTTNPTANSQVIVFDQNSVSVIQANGQSCYIVASSTTTGTPSGTTTGSFCTQQTFTLVNTLTNNWEGTDQYGNYLYYYQVSSTITNNGDTPLINVEVLSPSAGDITFFWGIQTIGTCNPDPVCYYSLPSYANLGAGQTYTFGAIFGFIEPETDVQGLFYPY